TSRSSAVAILVTSLVFPLMVLNEATAVGTTRFSWNALVMIVPMRLPVRVISFWPPGPTLSAFATPLVHGGRVKRSVVVEYGGDGLGARNELTCSVPKRCDSEKGKKEAIPPSTVMVPNRILALIGIAPPILFAETHARSKPPSGHANEVAAPPILNDPGPPLTSSPTVV